MRASARDRRCIYCLEYKPDGAFRGREHVIPQAFGLFESNFVLKCVCDTCNKFFGDGIDLKLARDSVEAIDRVTVGLKRPSEYKSVGPRSTTRFEFLDGPLSGAIGYHRSNPAGSNLRVTPLPSIGVSKAPDGPFDWFPADAMPTKRILETRGFKSGTKIHIRTLEIDPARVDALLRENGFEVLTVGPDERPILENSLVRGDTVARASHPEFRAITKIAINYIAAVAGVAIVLRDEFNPAREYVRFGVERNRVPVHVFENPWFAGRSGHYVSVGRRNELVVAQLSICLRNQYAVVLASNGEKVPLLSTAHFFDLKTRRLQEIEPLPLHFGRKRKPIQI